MAIAAQTLADESACYVCAGASLAQAFELALLARIVANGGGTTPTNDRVTEAGDVRITESGDTRIIE